MFHVSTLLPLYKKDPQQLERKKHIGMSLATHVSCVVCVLLRVWCWF
jgi:hypothetical protein